MTEWEKLDTDQLLAVAEEMIEEEPVRPEVVALITAILVAPPVDQEPPVER